MRWFTIICLFASAVNCVGEDKPPVTSLTVVTYNILASQERSEERIPALFKILSESKAEIILLQETRPWFVELLKKEEWARKKYWIKTPDGVPAVDSDQLILSRFPIKKVSSKELPGRMKRSVLIADIGINDWVLTIATSHLESYPEDADVRAEQLDFIFKELKDAPHAIFAGDFNFGDAAVAESKHLNKDFRDVWQSLNPKEPGFTWNMDASDMARVGSFPEDTNSRIDRVLVKSTRLLPKSIKIIGDKPVIEGKKDLFPSDHFGLLSEFAIKLPEE